MKSHHLSKPPQNTNLQKTHKNTLFIPTRQTSSPSISPYKEPLLTIPTQPTTEGNVRKGRYLTQNSVPIQEGLKFETSYDMIVKQNQRLKQVIKTLNQQKMEIIQKSKLFQAELQILMKNTENKTKNNEKGKFCMTFQNFGSSTSLDAFNEKQQLRQTERAYSAYNLNSLESGKHNSSNVVELLKKLIVSLQEQNNLLISFKSACLSKISFLKNQIKSVSSENQNSKQENYVKNKQLQEHQYLHFEDRKDLQKMDQLLSEAKRQLDSMSRRIQVKDQQMREMHEKFHKQIERMREKVSRYKSKAHLYRKERDDFGLEIQKARIELGTVTLRKYFPEESQDDI